MRNGLIRALKSLPEVLYAEPDGDATTNLIPVDGMFGQQWNMRNLLVPGADIHAEPAWDIFTGNPNAIIAVIDAGVDINHNDLAAKVNGGDVGFTLGFDPAVGQFSHGSHVAGIAAAVTNNNNNNGVAGVDWQARIHSRNVINNNSGDAGISQGIINAVNFSPNVWTLNHSWGLINSDGTPGRYSTTVRSAFANVYRNNRVSCIAMGNFHTGAPNADDVAGFPAGINSGVIAVGATDINDGIAGFSARGQHIDVSAPGVNILSTNFNNNYVVLSGTSMATPHVAGLASLLKGFNTNLANDDIEQIIRLTVDDVNAAGFPGFDNQMGFGRIDAQRALQNLQAPNQLFQLNVTGGTIFSTSGNETKIFLGFPGLPDAAYTVRRSEVRTNVTFPTAMCNMLGAWGRGVGTTGYREEQGTSYGEGICEVVPGTLTNSGATLRTWIYEVWSINGQYLGFYPRSANNVIFQYTVLGVASPSAINGTNPLCSSEVYQLNSALPVGASVSWQATPTGRVSLNQTGNMVTLTKITNGSVTLTATISNGCNNLTLSRPIAVGTPSSSYTLITRESLNTCYWDVLALNKSTATSMEWDGVPLEPDYYVNTGLFFVQKDVPGPNTMTYSIRGVNDCGAGPYLTKSVNVPAPWRSESTCFTPARANLGQNVEEEVSSSDLKLYPNPATSTVNIIFKAFSIRQVRVYNSLGILIKTLVYKQGVSNLALNVSHYRKGLYIIHVFDGKHWEKQKFIVQ